MQGTEIFGVLEIVQTAASALGALGVLVTGIVIADLRLRVRNLESTERNMLQAIVNAIARPGDSK